MITFCGRRIWSVCPEGQAAEAGGRGGSAGAAGGGRGSPGRPGARAVQGPATRDEFLEVTRIFRRQKSASPSLCREDEMREYARYSSPTCMILIDLSVTLPDTHLQSRRAVPATGFKINSFSSYWWVSLAGGNSKS